MKKKLIYTITALFSIGFLASCLEDKGYTDIVDAVNAENVIASWYGNDGTPSNKTVALPSGEDVSDYKLTVSVTGAEKLDQDYSLTIAVDPGVITTVNSNITDPSSKFFILPDSAYDLPSLTATIASDTTEGTFIVKFFAEKIDKGKNYILPLTIQGQDGLVVATNAGTTKLTFIGNPIAGNYNWDFVRYSNPGGTGSPDGASFSEDVALFAPDNGTTIRVPTGYYDHADYVVTFTNTGGVLSNFKAVIDPTKTASDGAWTAAGIKVDQAPVVTLYNAAGDVITSGTSAVIVKYKINYTTLTRNCTDIYYK